MWIKYTLSALAVLAGKVLTYLFAPIIALPPFIVYQEESETTDYPSLYPSKRASQWNYMAGKPLGSHGAVTH